jgi:hypothetical protein
MRMGLPQMLGLSLAVHLAVGLAVVSSHAFSSGKAAFSPEPAPSTSLIFTVRTKPAPDRQEQLSDNLRAESDTSPGAVADPLSPFPAIPVRAPAEVPAVALKSSSVVQMRSPLDPAAAPSVDGRTGIVFVLDISGSMYEPYAGATRLAFARQILAQRVRALKEGTPFSIVVYGETTRRSGPLVPADDSTRAAAIAFLNHDYDCGGGTDLPRGLISAEELHMGSVLLVTDGDLNANSNVLLPKVRDILDGGASLAVIGIGPRSNTDANDLLQALADQEEGTYQPVLKGDPTDLLTSAKSEAAAH